MSDPNDPNDPKDSNDPAADLGAEPDHHGRRWLTRLVAGAAAVVLVAAAAWILLGNRHPTRSADAYCRKIQSAATLRSALATGNADQIRAAVNQFRGAADVAPAEIEAQTQVLVDYAEGLTATLDTAGHSEAEIRAALSDAVSRQNDRAAEVAAAGQAIDAYARDTCHFDPGATTATTG